MKNKLEKFHTNYMSTIIKTSLSLLLLSLVAGLLPYVGLMNNITSYCIAVPLLVVGCTLEITTIIVDIILNSKCQKSKQSNL